MNSDKEITMHVQNWFKCFLTAAMLILSPLAVSAVDVESAATQRVQIDINSADAQTLAESLIGVGMVRAKEIVAYRELFGKFRSIDELLEVQGIGSSTLEKNRHLIVIATDS